MPSAYHTYAPPPPTLFRSLVNPLPSALLTPPTNKSLPSRLLQFIIFPFLFPPGGVFSQVHGGGAPPPYVSRIAICSADDPFCVSMTSYLFPSWSLACCSLLHRRTWQQGPAQHSCTASMRGAISLALTGCAGQGSPAVACLMGAPSTSVATHSARSCVPLSQLRRVVAFTRGAPAAAPAWADGVKRTKAERGLWPGATIASTTATFMHSVDQDQANASLTHLPTM